MNTTSSAPILPAGQFYGAVNDVWRTGLVTLTLLRHAVPRQVPQHGHQHMFLSLLLEGSYREWVEDRELAYRPLSLVFHPENLEHRDEIAAADTLFFTVEIDPAFLGSRDRRHRGLCTVRELTGGPSVWRMLRLLEAVRGHRRDSLDCEEPVTEILEDLLGKSDVAIAASPRWLVRVVARLEAGYRDPVSLGSLAELAGVHPVHVARVFRRHQGCTIGAFVHRLRVLHASREIAAGTTSLAATAVDAGFYDQAHMNHVFKAITGMTPSHYRLVVHSTGA